MNDRIVQVPISVSSNVTKETRLNAILAKMREIEQEVSYRMRIARALEEFIQHVPKEGHSPRKLVV